MRRRHACQAEEQPVGPQGATKAEVATVDALHRALVIGIAYVALARRDDDDAILVDRPGWVRRLRRRCRQRRRARAPLDPPGHRVDRDDFGIDPGRQARQRRRHRHAALDPADGPGPGDTLADGDADAGLRAKRGDCIAQRSGRQIERHAAPGRNRQGAEQHRQRKTARRPHPVRGDSRHTAPSRRT